MQDENHTGGRDVILWTGDPEPTTAPTVSHLPERETIAWLVDRYLTDPLSTIHRQRFHVRKNHRSLLRRIVERHGDALLADITGRTLIAWHREWCGLDGTKLATGHAFVSMLRGLCTFGFTLLAHPDCHRLSLILSKMRFKDAAARTDRLLADQADAVRHWAHVIGWHSIALAQAFQFELMLRQKDVIGEWEPLTEPGESAMEWLDQKWLRGLLWSEIDDDLILRHITSKRLKPVVVDLKNAPMVMEELEYFEDLPHDGPVIFCEATSMPYSTPEFRRKWRIVANYAGVPKNVRNMDSRSGAISEAFEAGISGEQIQKAATHSNIAMTQRYNRGRYLTASNEVATLRVASRNKARATGAR